MKVFVLAMAAATCIAVAVPAAAHEAVYVANLSGAAESPPNASAGTGVAIITFDLDLVTMRVQATFSGLSGNTTASHIHCCTAVPGAGTAGVATVTPTFTAFPLGVTSGSYDRTFDMAVASSYNAAFITNNGGSVATALSALVSGYDSGRAYFNLHSSFAPGGELRGFLVPVPEVSTYALMLVGLTGLGFVAGKKKATGAL
jgi:CHRD domain